MKKIKIVVPIVCCILVGVVLVAAVKSPPKIRIQSDDSSFVMSFNDLKEENGKLYLCTDVNCVGANYEIAKDITIAEDKSFTKTIEANADITKNGTIVYELNADNIDTVYVKAPVLYKTDKISTASKSLDSSNKEFLLDDSLWFTIDYTSETELEDFYIYTIEIEAVDGTDTLPRYPKIYVDGQEFLGDSYLIFDENYDLLNGTFRFYLPNNIKISEANDVHLNISDVLVKQTNSETVVKVCK